jgi:hypothetical protein
MPGSDAAWLLGAITLLGLGFGLYKSFGSQKKRITTTQSNIDKEKIKALTEFAKKIRKL